LFLSASNKLWNANRVLVGNINIKRQLGRTKLRWKGNIKMYLKEMEWECVNLMIAAQDREK
jgi:hypothetical protein